MLQTIKEWDREVFLFFNGMHTPWLDPVMFWGTKTWIWIPLFLFLLFFTFKKFRKEWWVVIIGIAITILIADQVTSSLMKPYFARLRPSREPTLEHLIYLVDGYTGGTYGFASSHAANTFGTAMFFWLVFRKETKWVGLLFLWAGFMTYTRLYLGVHYPGDILAGMMVGVGGACIGYWVTRKLLNRRARLHAEAPARTAS